ncbi:MAG: hypothetical protein J6O49_11440 [Bacteroidaceae bacterium]|nr:hypothetical protein [Bacteroidaceae bacterium]
MSGNATTATTAGSLTTGRDFTIGKTTKSSVKWDGAVAFTQAEISDCASNTADGWMSKDDKAKLDQITVSDIGRVSADTIVGETNGGITVTVTSGVAKLKHTNQLSAAGTAQGTANGTTLTNGGTFTIPKITYDINGHITVVSTNTLTLPSITSVSGNAGTATKFASAQSVTLTGDTTGTASSQAGWSIETKTVGLSGLNSSWQPQSGTSSRPTTANVNFHDNKVRYFLATSSMTEGKPVADAKILHLAWDNSGCDSQIALTTGNVM